MIDVQREVKIKIIYFYDLNVNFYFDVSVANDAAIDVARCALPGKVMQGSPCLEVSTSTNENERYIMKLNESGRTFI